MTDKQIIIDGVDVSGCVNLRLEANTAETSYYNACSIGLWQRWYSNLEPSCQMSCHCKNNKDCYYKKWQRKEQECEKAKQNAHDTYELYKALMESFNILQGEKIKLEQECEELKKANDEKNELLIKLGCPTTATAKRKVAFLEKEINLIKEANEEIKTDLKNWEERFILQNNFIDSLLKATNNTEWVDKSISDDEVHEIIEKIELDYVQLNQLKTENEELKKQLEKYKDKEQWEIELNKKRADSFKEMRRMLYGKVEGSSLIEKRNPYEN